MLGWQLLSFLAEAVIRLLLFRQRSHLYENQECAGQQKVDDGADHGKPAVVTFRNGADIAAALIDLLTFFI